MHFYTVFWALGSVKERLKTPLPVAALSILGKQSNLVDLRQAAMVGMRIGDHGMVLPATCLTTIQWPRQIACPTDLLGKAPRVMRSGFAMVAALLATAQLRDCQFQHRRAAELNSYLANLGSDDLVPCRRGQHPPHAV